MYDVPISNSVILLKYTEKYVRYLLSYFNSYAIFYISIYYNDTL